MAGNRTPTQSWCAQHPPMPEQNQPKSRVTWHYILAPDARRPQSYQYLAPSAQAPTVEDQLGRRLGEPRLDQEREGRARPVRHPAVGLLLLAHREADRVARRAD